MASARTILIIDDNREFVHGLQAVLESKGYRALTAYNTEGDHDDRQRRQPPARLRRDARRR